ncbi:MAG: Sec-independent protein translocase protein TatB [Leucothrix sp.]
MFDAGFLEMLVIGIIALVVIGPERLPGVARTIGGWIGKARAFVDSTKRDIEREINASEMRELLDSQKKEIDELRNIVDDTKESFKQQASEVTKSFTDSAKTLQETTKTDSGLSTSQPNKSVKNDE